MKKIEKMIRKQKSKANEILLESEGEALAYFYYNDFHRRIGLAFCKRDYFPKEIYILKNFLNEYVEEQSEELEEL
jgi:hypothetical protein